MSKQSNSNGATGYPTPSSFSTGSSNSISVSNATITVGPVDDDDGDGDGDDVESATTAVDDREPTHECRVCGSNQAFVESAPAGTYRWCEHEDCDRVTRWRRLDQNE